MQLSEMHPFRPKRVHSFRKAPFFDLFDSRGALRGVMGPLSAAPIGRWGRGRIDARACAGRARAGVVSGVEGTDHGCGRKY